jgi:uncharacterized protein (DUF427 family)
MSSGHLAARPGMAAWHRIPFWQHFERTIIMVEKLIKVPGPDHPITIETNPHRIVVTLGGQTLAETNSALTLHEAEYPAVHYIPRADVDMTRLARTAHTTYCPFKGDCSYFSLPDAGERGVNAVWTYEAPFPAVEAIKDHLAFYRDRVEIKEDR